MNTEDYSTALICGSKAVGSQETIRKGISKVITWLSLPTTKEVEIYRPYLIKQHEHKTLPSASSRI